MSKKNTGKIYIEENIDTGAGKKTPVKSMSTKNTCKMYIVENIDTGVEKKYR